MDAPLARHLARFSAMAPVAPPIEPDDDAPPIREDFAECAPQITLTVADLEARLDAARRGARADAATAHGHDRDALVAAHALATGEAVAAAIAQTREAEGRIAAEQIEGVLADLRDTIGGTLADAIRPLLAEAVAARALAALIEAVDGILADPDHPVLTVRGPAEQVAAIEAACGTRDGLRFIVGDGPDILVTANGMRVETRLAAAMASLSDTPPPSRSRAGETC